MELNYNQSACNKINSIFKRSLGIKNHHKNTVNYLGVRDYRRGFRLLDLLTTYRSYYKQL
jgi:hypothetical protein